MLDIKALEKNEDNYLENYKKSLQMRGADPAVLDQALEINKQRKSSLTEAENLKAEQNKVGKEIALKNKNKEDSSDLLKQMGEISKKAKELNQKASDAEEELNQLLATIPNKLHKDTPEGNSEEDNQHVRSWGEPKTFDFEVKDHSDLGEALGVLDFERASKVTGARFTFLKGAASRMERALIQFMMDTHVDEHGYEEMIPPFIVNSKSLYGTSQLPKFKEDLFHLEGTDYFLIPTAEVPVTNYYAGEILSESDLPQKFCAYTPCFRSEAGSYGRDTKGLIRQHQFDKVELMVFAHPDNSYELHEQLTAHAEKILQKLELPYRVMALCAGDIGFGASKCYDIEVWLPEQKTYREISSCSNFEDFQARRAGIRFKSGSNKPQYVHTLNGSGLAVGRTLLAIFENYQQQDGSIKVPKALQSYMGGLQVIRPK
ncbi:MAG: serine--tRNA ligase [Bdellovibrionales bacterium]|nr:serine--tRNA ligase [Bdellovibrionales bacterium]